MTRYLAVFLFSLLFIPPAAAQLPGGVLPEAGIAVTPSDEPRRLGNLVNDQMRQFKMRKDCELDLPECLPAIRAIIEQEERDRMWMGLGILAILLLLVLVAMREGEKKRAQSEKEWANHKKLGDRIKAKWRGEVTDPYKDSDPLGDE
ncbi:MAG: hypothetical protein HN793_12655 [Rhodospirillaceae bacterium]|jgi:hypothetical protein|nr:hypothetical protein [Rhodospirillaceae bacterium]MBT5566238.1 hypothetical protein [Rhodospirillaceae bacterium]MBT6088956.1 hypothetical protein [Rhodospirillaceae bacterium]MBT7451677.1 hypothetical protein [Rhodospirillaceae bacterium]